MSQVFADDVTIVLVREFLSTVSIFGSERGPAVVVVFQNEDDMDKEIVIGSDTLGSEGERVDPSNFELLKVLGQGSFGKVGVPGERVDPSNSLRRNFFRPLARIGEKTAFLTVIYQFLMKILLV